MNVTAEERSVAFDDAVTAVKSLDVNAPRATVEALLIDSVNRTAPSLNDQRLQAGRQLLSRADLEGLTRWISDELVGLGPIEGLLRDETVEEIAVTRWDLVFVYHSNGLRRKLKEPLWSSDKELTDWLGRIARTKSRTEREFNSRSPLLVLDLGEGLRLEAHRDVSRATGFTLRRNTLGTLEQASLAQLSATGMMPAPVAEFLAALMKCPEMRFVFGGSTGAGKSTLARACLEELGPLERVVIVEDTAELSFFDELRHPNVESWEAREANAEGAGEVTMGDLVVHGLRARPDWLVVGECRGPVSAVPMLNAMTFGQSSLSTVHAPTARGVVDKLAFYLTVGGLPSKVAHEQVSIALDFAVHTANTSSGRVVTEIVEIERFDGEHCQTSLIWSRRPGVALGAMTSRRAELLREQGFDPTLLRPALQPVPR